MMATSLRSLNRLTISLPSISTIRAEAWASLVRIGICQPCQERAWMPIALQAIGIQARSWQGWQIPIRTSDAHASARIVEIDGKEIVNRFKDRKEVAIIAGFQGINADTGRITTL